MSDLENALKPMVEQIISEEMKSFDVEGQVRGLLEEVAGKATRVLEVKLGGTDGDGVKFPLVHNQFELLLQIVALGGLNVLLTGGAGLSKSTAVAQVAEALGLGLGSISFSNQTTKTDLFGFVDAMGVRRGTAFTDAYENGNLFLGDEQDACSANVFVMLNSAIENGFFSLPDGTIVKQHENFRYVGTANTNLRGAKDGFVARNKADAASVDRFVIINWLLDEILEEKITDNSNWLDIVRACREKAEDELEGVTITPRSSYQGAKLLKAGIDPELVFQMTVIKGMEKDTEEVLRSSFSNSMLKRCQQDVGVKKVTEPEAPKKVVELEVEEPIYTDPIEAEEEEFAELDGEW